jgi:hypothetical protein
MGFDEALERARRDADKQDRLREERHERAADLRRRVKDAGVQAAAALGPYGNGLFIRVKPGNMFLRGRLRDDTGQRYREVSVQACWLVEKVDRPSDEPACDVLLLADGTVGIFCAVPQSLRPMDPHDPYRRRFTEYVTTVGLDPMSDGDLRLAIYGRGDHFVGEIERKLADTVVRYERQGHTRNDLD